MGILTFFLIVAISCVGAWAVCWLLRRLDGVPTFMPYVIWGVACIVIFVTLAYALGLRGINPTIPRVLG